MIPFRDINDKRFYAVGRAHGFGEGIIFSCIIAMLFGLLVFLAR